MTESRSHVAHPWAMVIIGYWALTAAGLLTGPWLHWTPVLSLAGVEGWLTIAIGVLIAAGSGLILASLGRWRLRSTRWTLELSGLILAGGGWFAFGWAASTVFPAGLGWAQGAAFMLSCVLRAREVILIERRTRQAVQHLEGDH